ncbi:hypothetical protein CZ797_07110 [Pseudoalteromonas sp. JB197]|nr:hypothetical protein CZ797_07110 [Pseudoalteromonas sp. JB197]
MNIQGCLIAAFFILGNGLATVALSAKKHIYKEVKRRCRFR